MGYTKLFGLWLAQAIYKREMTDPQIISAVISHKNVEMGNLKEQIQAVRDNPNLYRPLADRGQQDVYEFFDEMRAQLASVDEIGDNDDAYLP
jgi:hypothetical protein